MLEGLDDETKLSQIAFWVVRAGREGLVYGFKLPCCMLAPDRGTRHEQDCLKALALYEFGKTF